jgi:hypothetical protein
MGEVSVTIKSLFFDTRSALIKSGLQCHTAPFSWKLVFECDHQLYEMIMTACSQKEEMEWRTRLSDVSQFVSHEQSDLASYSWNYLHIKSLGTVFRKPGEHSNVN